MVQIVSHLEGESLMLMVKMLMLILVPVLWNVLISKGAQLNAMKSIIQHKMFVCLYVDRRLFLLRYERDCHDLVSNNHNLP